MATVYWKQIFSFSDNKPSIFLILALFTMARVIDDDSGHYHTIASMEIIQTISVIGSDGFLYSSRASECILRQQVPQWSSTPATFSPF
ncbi:hypothetical protein GDO78_021296 [Eleutherodactylus coqui]|uniref:Uncharacterized protein n=1 Tax=Eleutherodactylus coqui TaxID=57060 RepID=A0A8J6BNG6_ELECQ|nr:hypothetical protein GDO78_021296 [Eleutherodactylus coqui]